MIEFKGFLKCDSFLSEFYFIQFSTSYDEFRHNIKSDYLYAVCDKNNNMIIDKNMHIMCFEDVLTCKVFCRKHKLQCCHVAVVTTNIYALLHFCPGIGIIINKTISHYDCGIQMPAPIPKRIRSLKFF